MQKQISQKCLRKAPLNTRLNRKQWRSQIETTNQKKFKLLQKRCFQVEGYSKNSIGTTRSVQTSKFILQTEIVSNFAVYVYTQNQNDKYGSTWSTNYKLYNQKRKKNDVAFGYSCEPCFESILTQHN